MLICTFYGAFKKKNELTGFACQFGITDEHVCLLAVVTTTQIVLTAHACQNDMWSNLNKMQNKCKNFQK